MVKMNTTPNIQKLSLPIVYCYDCKSQVLLSDAIGRRTSPTYRIHGTNNLVCILCAKKRTARDLVALTEYDAKWFPTQVMSTPDVIGFLTRLGARWVK